jgi:small GTP-binding protein
MNIPDEFDNVLKIIILGDSKVGKTNFLHQFLQETYTESPSPTEGFDYKSHILTLPDSSKIKLQIWDTVGLEKYMAINRSLLLKVQGIILMYDITHIQTFESINKWIEYIKEVNEDAPIILVANKCDLDNERMVIVQKGIELAEKHGISFVEASAKDNKNVEKTFVKLSQDILTNVLNKNPNLNPNDDDQMFGNISFRESFLYEGEKQKFKCPNCIML